MKKLFGCVALFIWGQSCLYAQERVYTTVDAQGRVQIIKSEMPKKEDKEKESSTEKKHLLTTLR